MDQTEPAEPPVIQELPLFPLGVVLFPHMPLPLHIFEERYRAMIDYCIRESRPFGVVLITDGCAEEPGAITCQVGCMARIARVERLPQGEMSLLVVGEQRFRILDADDAARPYRVGSVVPLKDAAADASAVVPLADEVHRLLTDFLTRSLALAGQPAKFELPDEPEQLSYTAACVLPLDNEKKQALLETTDTAARLTVERETLRREVVKLRRAAAAKSSPQQVHSETFAAFRCLN